MMTVDSGLLYATVHALYSRTKRIS